MNLIELVQDSLWAVHPAKLEEINAAILRVLEGNKLDFPAVSAEEGAGSDDVNNDAAAVPDSRIAVIPVYGTLMKRANLFTRFSGGTSYQLIERDIEAALSDPQVTGIVLDIDSPGGAVDGCIELADYIYEHRGRKPIIAYSGGLMCSAAQWIGSACDMSVLGQASQCGSIGVRMVHYDLSKRDEMQGIKRTEIYSGKYKAIGTDSEPLSKEAKEYLQARSDYYYSMFVEGFARNRGVAVEKALTMADGKLFIGKQALDAGLVDHIGTLKLAIELAGKTSNQKGTDSMDEKEFKAMQERMAAMESKLATAEAKAAEADTLKVALDAEKIARVELTKSLRMKDIEAQVKTAIVEGKLLPAKVEAGVVQFIGAIDKAEPFMVGEKSFKPSDWFAANFLTDNVVVSMDSHFTSFYTAHEQPGKEEDAVSLGMSIAQMAGAIPGGSDE